MDKCPRVTHIAFEVELLIIQDLDVAPTCKGELQSLGETILYFTSMERQAYEAY